MENRSFTQNTNFELNNDAKQNERPPVPNNYMVLAVISIVLGLCQFPCCISFILGVIAIIYSNQVSSKYNYGDYLGAEQSSKNAKMLSIISLVLAAIGLIYFIIVIMSAGYTGMIESYREILEEYSNQ